MNRLRAAPWRLLPFMESIIIHYGELALKGNNRPLFLRKLIDNIRRAIENAVVRIDALQGRIHVIIRNDADAKILCKRIALLPGVANAMTVRECAPSMEDIKNTVTALLAGSTFSSFRIDARRGEKTLPFTSNDIARIIGAHVQSRHHAAVSLEQPNMTVYIEALTKKIFCGTEKIQGAGGLPSGSSGNAVSLLSGGIDSPVASRMMMVRGCRLVFIHFHSYPYLGRASIEKAEELAGILDRAQFDSRLWIVPLGDAQKKIMELSAPAWRVVLYRRMMVRIASAIAEKEKASVLITGENLGQVASQTAENIATIENASPIPILRPLIGMNKENIIAEAKRLGTYEISIRPDDDCCQLFVPAHPATKTTITQIQSIEKKLDTDELVRDCIAHAELKEF